MALPGRSNTGMDLKLRQAKFVRLVEMHYCLWVPVFVCVCLAPIFVLRSLSGPLPWVAAGPVLWVATGLLGLLLSSSLHGTLPLPLLQYGHLSSMAPWFTLCLLRSSLLRYYSSVLVL